MFNKKVIYALLFVLALLLLSQCSMKPKATKPEGLGARFSVYGTMRCGYTVKMLDYLQKELGQTVRFVDVSVPEGDAEFKEITSGKNIRGIPFTVDHHTGETISGFQKKINL